MYNDDEHFTPAEGYNIPEYNLQKKPEPKVVVTPRKSDKIKVILFAALLCVSAVIGLLIFLRPTVSESEKRELTKFPTPDVDSVVSGKYTSEISLWYSDTFPWREGIIGLNARLKALTGIKTVEFSGNKGDDIPDAPITGEDTNGEDVPGGDPSGIDPGNTNGEKIGGFYVQGNTAYELYAFNLSNSGRYAKIISNAASCLGDKVKVYDLIVPLSYSIYLDSETQNSINASDCRKAIKYMYDSMPDTVYKIDAMTTLENHSGEYLFFRTDHHWTALGAYYAYTAFCNSANITPTPLSSYRKLEFGGFLGTLYQDTQSQNLKNSPDTVYAYVPIGTNTAHVTERGGKEVDYQIVNEKTDVWYQNAASKYNCFIAGDNPLSVIHNPQKSDGSAIMIVKESFGNAFVPFLVDSYEYVYVVDYRYYAGTLSELVSGHNIGTVLFVNNVIATSTSARLNALDEFVK